MQLRWRSLAAAEAGAAASGAAGMPVRWPRRPCAVSAAVVADAGPDLSCAGDLERPLELRIGKIYPPPVGASVARSLSRSALVESLVNPPSWSALFGVVCGDWGSGFPLTPEQDYGYVSGLVRVSSSVINAVCAYLLARLLRRVALRFSCPSLFVGLALARARLERWWHVRTLLVDYTRELGVRGALLSWFAAVACFSCLN